MYMIKVKLCGLRRVEDIIAVNHLRPDFAGFVFAPGKRKVTPELARALRKSLKPPVRAVGVFAGFSAAETAAIAEWSGMDIVQLHGEEDAEYIKTLRMMLPSGYEIWKAAHVRTSEDIQTAVATGADRLLLDAFSPDAIGGTGTSFNWDIIRECEIPVPFLVAGGLSADNVADAVRTAQPYGVDVSSGIETGGLKDAAKMAQFVWAARGQQAQLDEN